jgi:hypothetical protein
LAGKATRFLVIPGGNIKRIRGPKDGNEWKRHIDERTGFWYVSELRRVKQTVRISAHDLIRPFEEVEALTLRPKPKAMRAPIRPKIKHCDYRNLVSRLNDGWEPRFYSVWKNLQDHINRCDDCFFLLQAA